MPRHRFRWYAYLMTNCNFGKGCTFVPGACSLSLSLTAAILLATFTIYDNISTAPAAACAVCALFVQYNFILPEACGV